MSKHNSDYNVISCHDPLSLLAIDTLVLSIYIYQRSITNGVLLLATLLTIYSAIEIESE